jgi:hypothetical protein
MTADVKNQEGALQAPSICEISSEMPEIPLENDADETKAISAVHASPTTGNKDVSDSLETAPSPAIDNTTVEQRVTKKEQMRCDRARVQNAINSASPEEIAEIWIPAIMDNQTEDERISGDAKGLNGEGLNKFDAGFITDISKQVQSGRCLSSNQLDSVKKKLSKYWRQFLLKVPEEYIGNDVTTPTNDSVQKISPKTIAAPTFAKTGISLEDTIAEIHAGKVLNHRSDDKKKASHYEFIIRGKSFTVSLKDLFAGHFKFRLLYANTHKIIPFANELVEIGLWREIVEWIIQIAEDAGLEDTNALIGARCFVDYIESNFTITEDLSIFLNTGASGDKIGRFIQESGKHTGEEFLILPAFVVADILSEYIPVRISNVDLSNALRALGYIDGKTRGKKIKGRNINCWWFNPDKLNIDDSISDRGVTVDL